MDDRSTIPRGSRARSSSALGRRGDLLRRRMFDCCCPTACPGSHGAPRLTPPMVHNPHDALFKAVFGQPEHARGALQAVVPPALAEALDWSKLTLRPGSYVDVALREQFTDLLYSATWRGGGDVLVYFLFEHQSTLPTPPNDGLMAFRM